MEFNKERVQIGWYILKEDTEHTDAGYECAAWYETCKVPAGKYPIYANWKYHERDRKYINEIEYRSPRVTLEGVITGSNFSSYFCGNMVAPKFDEEVGKKTSHTLTFYDFSLIGMMKGGEYEQEGVEVELPPEFYVKDVYFMSSIDERQIHIQKIALRQQEESEG